MNRQVERRIVVLYFNKGYYPSINSFYCIGTNRQNETIKLIQAHAWDFVRFKSIYKG